MAQTKRRRVLKLAGGTAAVSLGGMAGILATGRTPAYAQQRTVHWLKWVDFVPATDQLFRKEMMPEAEKALGVKMNLETVNGNDLQPRTTAAIQSGAGRGQTRSQPLIAASQGGHEPSLRPRNFPRELATLRPSSAQAFPNRPK